MSGREIEQWCLSQNDLIWNCELNSWSNIHADVMNVFSCIQRSFSARTWLKSKQRTHRSTERSEYKENNTCSSTLHRALKYPVSSKMIEKFDELYFVRSFKLKVSTRQSSAAIVTKHRKWFSWQQFEESVQKSVHKIYQCNGLKISTVGNVIVFAYVAWKYFQVLFRVVVFYHIISIFCVFWEFLKFMILADHKPNWIW